MSEESKFPSHSEIQATITKAVWKNDGAREEFLKNPKASVTKYTGVVFKDDMKVVCVNQENQNDLYLVLPAHPSQALGVDFSDEQLDAIAGGLSLSGLLGGLSSALGAVSTGASLVGVGTAVVGGIAALIPLP